MSENILLMKNISKSFPGVQALQNVNLDLRYGEVHALLGENGAGKSTLLKVLAGIYTADEGEIILEGEKRNITSVEESQKLGISVIHQELCLVPHMTIMENIYLGREKTTVTGMVDKKYLNKKAKEVLDSLDINLSPQQKVASLSIADQQMVEIAKAISLDASIIVMDEPTSSLSDKEVASLFKMINKLKQNRVAIIYISHKLDELFKITDRITVLRDGKYIDTVETKTTNRDDLISMMVGRKLTELYAKKENAREENVLEVKNLSRKGVFNDVSFNLRKGEILGFAGLVGAGRSEVMRAVFGVDQYDEGSILIEGNEVKIKKASEAIDVGIALVPENRKEEGLVLINTVRYNMTLCVLKEFIKGMIERKDVEKKLCDEYVGKLEIKTPSIEQTVKNLSGGNQQKVVLAKWIMKHPKILILDEPTRGIDVGAKAEIYNIMSNLTEQGVGIIFISSELPEIVNMSDRVMIMRNGEIAGEVSGADINQENIMKYATGGKING